MKAKLSYNSDVKVSELGEFGLIELMAEVLGSSLLASPDQTGILAAIGDDAALWRSKEGIQILTVDTMVEGIHFRLDTTPWRDLGWKVIAVNLSDIAAMGGDPQYAVISLGLHPDTTVESVQEMYRGMREICEEFGCSVVGGDTVSAPCAMLSVTVTGLASYDQLYPSGVLLRSQARVGDKIAVTGYLGSSGAGLKMLLGGLKIDKSAVDYLRRAHNRPMPRVPEGKLLLREGVRAAMDLSDGLLSDLPKLCRASGVSARVKVDDVPIHPDVKAVFGEESLELALGAGEDYELLFTADEPTMEKAMRSCPTRVTVIGEALAGEPGDVALYRANGEEFRPRKRGWEHFSASRSSL